MSPIKSCMRIAWSRRNIAAAALCAVTAACAASAAMAQHHGAPAQASLSVPGIGSGAHETSMPLQLLGLLTVLSVAPAILMMMTSFTRIVIVLGLTRSALGAQQIPPNQVLMGLALCLTFFTMQPVLSQINAEALQPFLAKRITSDQAMERAAPPIRRFMIRQTREGDLALFVELSRIPPPSAVRDVPTYVIVPAFIISELKTAFTMGFIIMLPFLVIDLVVSMILTGMGMMMMPPTVVSLPFKILLFVLVDGWHILARALALSF